MKKKIGTFTVCFILLIGAFLPNGKAMATIRSAIISVDAVNIREGPGLSYPLLTQVNKGDKFPILIENGDWSKLQLSKGKSGWVANWLITKSNHLLSPNSSNSDHSIALVNTNQLRVRTGPGTSFR
ncbi:MAG TPA: SH3 domain-containing protein, partial [Bacillales bacterium]|nr:SH3 domain-containing protein [Bacillales bacterium]